MKNINFLLLFFAFMGLIFRAQAMEQSNLEKDKYVKIHIWRTSKLTKLKNFVHNTLPTDPFFLPNVGHASLEIILEPQTYNIIPYTTSDKLTQIEPGEIALFCEEQDLYCKIYNKNKRKIIISDQYAHGLPQKYFSKLLHSLKNEPNPELFQEAAQYEQLKRQSITTQLYNASFEDIEESDKKALFQHLVSCGYVDSMYYIPSSQYVSISPGSIITSYEEDKKIRGASDESFTLFSLKRKKIFDFYTDQKFSLIEKAKSNGSLLILTLLQEGGIGELTNLNSWVGAFLQDLIYHGARPGIEYLFSYPIFYLGYGDWSSVSCVDGIYKVFTTWNTTPFGYEVDPSRLEGALIEARKCERNKYLETGEWDPLLP